VRLELSKIDVLLGSVGFGGRIDTGALERRYLMDVILHANAL
jgi:hypothetical protein